MGIIRKVYENKGSKQLLITIPQSNIEGIVKGDYIEIKKHIPKYSKGGKCIKCEKTFLNHTILELKKCELLTQEF